MSATFRSKQSYLQVAHDDLFHIGYQPYGNGYTTNQDTGEYKQYVTNEEMERIKKLPDWKNIGRGYLFEKGVDHNEFFTESAEVIEAMRVYIASRKDTLIVEMDENGEEPVLPEGTVFRSKIAGYQLYPAIYIGRTPADGKTFNFNMGAGRNEYITAVPEEISLIRSYVLSEQNCIISDPSYVPPVIE